MWTLQKYAIAAFSAALLSGAALAATRHDHVMNISLPGGGIAHVEYVGDVAPKVTIEPSAMPGPDWAPLPGFAGFDRMIAEMNRESEAMERQAQQLEQQPTGKGTTPYLASFGNVPAGVTSTTIISYSNGSGTCTRTTETVSQGQGKAPLTKSSLSGNCGVSAAPARPEASAAPISRT